MTPDERAIVQSTGVAILDDIVAQAVFGFFYGFFAPVSAIVVYYLMTHMGRTPLSWALLMVGIMCFINMNVIEGIHIWAGRSYYQILTSTTIPALQDRADALNNRITQIDIIEGWLEFIPPLFNDGFIIWRAWTLFDRRRWALYTSIFIWVSSIGITLAYLCLTTTHSDYESQDFISNEAAVVLGALTPWLSATTNAVATSFIGYTLWRHLKVLRKTKTPKLFGSWRILLILLESGAVYGVLQILTSIMTVAIPDTYAAYTAYGVIASMFYSISFVYPILTIALIRGPFSIVEIHETALTFQITQLEEIELGKIASGEGNAPPNTDTTVFSV